MFDEFLKLLSISEALVELALVSYCYIWLLFALLIFWLCSECVHRVSWWCESLSWTRWWLRQEICFRLDKGFCKERLSSKRLAIVTLLARFLSYMYLSTPPKVSHFPNDQDVLYFLWRVDVYQTFLSYQCGNFLAHLCNLHGRLICITICLSVRRTGPKIRLENNSYLGKYLNHPDGLLQFCKVYDWAGAEDKCCYRMGSLPTSSCIFVYLHILPSHLWLDNFFRVPVCCMFDRWFVPNSEV